MDALLLSALCAVGALLFVAGAAPAALAAIRERRAERRDAAPGLNPEAERRAEDLMASVIGSEGIEAYRALGFLHAFGDAEDDGQPGYGYLIYPHRPIVSFDARSGRLLSELCVRFPDRDSPAGERLPDADDVLAKWMAIRGDELGLLAEANVHPPGRQIDPEQARRDLVRLGEWTAEPSGTPPSDGFAAAQ